MSELLKEILDAAQSYVFMTFINCFTTNSVFVVFICSGYVGSFEVERSYHNASHMHTSSDELKKNYNAKHYFLEVNLGHLKQFDEDAESKLRTYPGKFLPAVRCSCLSLFNVKKSNNKSNKLTCSLRRLLVLLLMNLPLLDPKAKRR